MNVIVDGIIYQKQSQGGISHIYDEILPRMCNEYDFLKIDLLTSGPCKKALPVHSHIKHTALFPIDSFLRPTRLWRNKRFHIRAYLQHLTFSDSREKIWHSTYSTMPYNWKGPVVFSIYDMIHERFALDLFNQPYEEDYRIHKRQCAKEADQIICISEATKLDIEKFLQIDSGKIKVIHLASSPIFRQIENANHIPAQITSKPFLLYVGGRNSYKNFNNLLKAYGSWHSINEIDLVVVGRSWNKHELKLIKELKLEKHVFLVTDIDKEKLSILYNQATALVFPSLYEGFGIPLLEAMACGCPITASRIPTTLEIAGDFPVYFEPKEIDSIITALENVLNIKQNSDRVELGLKRARQFSWDITAHETLSIYRNLLNLNDRNVFD